MYILPSQKNTFLICDLRVRQCRRWPRWTVRIIRAYERRTYTLNLLKCWKYNLVTFSTLTRRGKYSFLRIHKYQMFPLNGDSSVVRIKRHNDDGNAWRRHGLCHTPGTDIDEGDSRFAVATRACQNEMFRLTRASVIFFTPPPNKYLDRKQNATYALRIQ